MLRKRIIPILLLKDGALVKGKNFNNYRYLGDSMNTIKIFNEKMADELIFIDIEATKSNKLIDLDFVRRGNDLKVSCYTNSTQELECWLHPDFSTFCENVLNPELAESCSYVMVYRKPRRGPNRYKGAN